jgi:hypothetical protein
MIDYQLFKPLTEHASRGIINGTEEHFPCTENLDQESLAALSCMLTDIENRVPDLLRGNAAVRCIADGLSLEIG